MEILVKQFLLYVERYKSLSTLENYTHYLANFVLFARERAITNTTPEDFFDWLQAKDYAVNTIGYHLAALKGLAGWCEKYGHPFISPKLITIPKYIRKEAVHLETEDMHTLLASIPTQTLLGLRNRALMEFLYSTGLRIGEVHNLNRSDVNLKTREFTVLGKGGKTRLVFMSNRAEEWMKKYLEARSDSHQALFIGFRRGSERLTTAMMEAIVREHARKLFDRKITCHTFRHSFATNLLVNGADIKAVQTLLGHENIQTTSMYLHLTNNRLRHIYDVCHF